MADISLTTMGPDKCKPLDRQSGRFFVRSGKAFVYINDQRYSVDHVPAVMDPDFDEGVFDPHKSVSDLNLRKDIAINGSVHFWGMGNVYALFFVDDTRKHNPIALRFAELED